MESTKTVTIDALLVSHSLVGARSTGLDIPRLLRKCGIEEQDLATPGKRLPVDKVVMLQNYCTGLLQDEINGLLDKPMPLGFFRFMAFSVVHARTLGCALQRIVDYYNLFSNSFKYALQHKDGHTHLKLQRLDSQRVTGSYPVDCLLTAIHRFVGWLCDERVIPEQVTMDFPPPPYQQEYLYMYYGAPVLFEQPNICLTLNSSVLVLPIVQNEDSVEGFLRRAPLDLYLPMDANGEFSVVVRKHLRAQFAKTGSIANLEEMAEQMKTSPQTLRRRLRAENSSFSAIKAQVRRDIAIHHLGLGMSIEAVAEKTGYAEASAFIRAFKVWTGYTPMQFRRGTGELSLEIPAHA